ncbi:MAG: hypothetical protein WCJ30_19275, partial [Deltaproteobacteria bacterium]
NWRGRAGAYPRFRDHGKPGVLSRALQEWDQFVVFCEKRIGVRPQPNRCDLTKIDHLIEGRDWTDLADLAVLLPWLESFSRFSQSDNPNLLVQFHEKREHGELSVALSSEVGQDSARVLKIETTVTRDVSSPPNLRDVFVSANDEANGVFEHLIPSDQRAKRFGMGAE